MAAVDACRAALGLAELDFVRTFQSTLDLEMNGAMLGLFHGSPRSHMEDLLATTAADDLDQALGECRATVMAGWHTHIQMLHRANYGGSMFRKHRLMAFIATRGGARAREFYERILGLRVISDDDYAIAVDANGTMLRIQKVAAFTPHSFTALGWEVPDIGTTVEKLSERGIQFERFPGWARTLGGFGIPRVEHTWPGSRTRTATPCRSRSFEPRRTRSLPPPEPLCVEIAGRMPTTAPRLAELMATLSLASDLTNGSPFEQSLSSAIVAVRLANAAGLSVEQARDAYYLTMLRTIGCTGDGDVGRLMLGDDVGAWLTHLPNGSPLALLGALLTQVGRKQRPLRRAATVARAFANLPRVFKATPIHCEVGKKLAERFDLGPGVARGLTQMFERWDGGGQPNRLKHEAIDLAVSTAHVATDAHVMRGMGGIGAAVTMVRARAGKGYAPRVAEALVNHAPVVLADDAPSVWDAVLSAEPGPHRRLSDDEAERAIRAMGEYADMKSGYFRGHSAGVSALAAGAARRLRFPDDDVNALARAGHLHDLGRGAVMVDVWEKKGPLTDGERERVRTHAYNTERILARAAFLGPAATLASQDHERLDGSGYHRRLPPAGLPMTVRVLAAADVYRALIEPRPHRPPHKADAAADELRREAREGRLDTEAVEAVLGAAGQETRAPDRPTGLSEREVEVLRCVARGLTNKEIATTLDISVKTAGHHVEHIFTKIGVTTRAAAGLFAMQNDLMV